MAQWTPVSQRVIRIVYACLGGSHIMILCRHNGSEKNHHVCVQTWYWFQCESDVPGAQTPCRVFQPMSVLITHDPGYPRMVYNHSSTKEDIVPSLWWLSRKSGESCVCVSVCMCIRCVCVYVNVEVNAYVYVCVFFTVCVYCENMSSMDLVCSLNI